MNIESLKFVVSPQHPLFSMEDTLSLSLDQPSSSKCVVSLNHVVPAQLGKSYQQSYQAMTLTQSTNGDDSPIYICSYLQPHHTTLRQAPNSSLNERTAG